MNGASRIGLIFNLKHGNLKHGSEPSEEEAEFDSQETIDAVVAAIETRFPCLPIEADQDCFSRLRDSRPDLVFNMAECLGGPAREGYIPSMLEFLRIPYTGSDPVTLNLCLHKVRAKEVLAWNGLATPAWTVIPVGAPVKETLGEIPLISDLPAVVKPLHEGSSRGIRAASLVRSPAQLKEQIDRIHLELHQPALVEQFLPGREFTVAMLGNGEGLEMLPIVELRFDALPPGAPAMYGYEAKWVWDTPDRPLDLFRCPAQIDPKLARRIEQLCRAAFTTLEVRDWCRIDVRLDTYGEPHIIELNPLPGILPKPEDNSCFPKAARTAGLSYAELIHRVLEVAAARQGLTLVTHS